MNLSPWAWLILPLAVCRGTQIVLWDRVFQRPRSWLLGKLNPQGLPMTDPKRPYLSYVLECPWCMSIWVGLAAVGLAVWEPTRQPSLAIGAALGLSLVAVVLDRMVDRWFPDQPHDDQPPQVTNEVHVHTRQPDTPPEALEAAFAEHAGDDTAEPG